MALLTLEAIGSRGEQLAMQAADARDIPVGWDSEFSCATYDLDGVEEEELQTIVFEQLSRLDPEWQDHLRIAE